MSIQSLGIEVDGDRIRVVQSDQVIQVGAVVGGGVTDHGALTGLADNDHPQYLLVSGAPELIRDTIGTALVAGANVTITVNDAGDTITIASAGGGSTDPEVVRDTIAAALVGATGITITANDPADTITITGPDLSGYLTSSAAPELIRDTIGTALVAGAGVTITVNDAGDTITLATTVTQYTDEQARDAIGTALVAGTGLTVTVNDPSDTITVALDTTAEAERIRDTIGTALVAGANVTITVNDAGDTITIASTGGGGSARGSLTKVATGATIVYRTPFGLGRGPETVLPLSFRVPTYFAPWEAPINATIKAVAIDVTTALAGEVVRVGIVRLDPVDGQPLALVADLGTVSVATTGRKEITGLNVALTAGHVYCSVLYPQNGGGSCSVQVWSLPTAWGVTSTPVLNRVIRWMQVSGSPNWTAGIPSPPTDWDSIDQGTNGVAGSFDAVLYQMEPA